MSCRLRKQKLAHILEMPKHENANSGARLFQIDGPLDCLNGGHPYSQGLDAYAISSK